MEQIGTEDNIFSEDTATGKAATVYGRKPVENFAAVIEADEFADNEGPAAEFADEIEKNRISDFEKADVDKMCHVSTFVYASGNIYMTYYANTASAEERPDSQVARLAYCPESDVGNKKIIDIMSVGDGLCGKRINGVYDTILMRRDDDAENLYVLWTAQADGKYYRLYRIFNIKTEKLGPIGVNRFRVGNITNDFSSTGMMNALAANGIGYKEFFSDIGIMQKLSFRSENGKIYYYTGTYSGNFTAIIKSCDLITWEYVAQPNEGADNSGFENETKWENAVYVLDNKVYYFVRQWDYDAENNIGSKYGILTRYDLNTGKWDKPVLVADCQSRSDFIFYKGKLYLFYAPTDRNHIGVLRINTDNIADSSVVFRADMRGSCFYPFVQYNSNGGLCMSYTVDRKHIRLAAFDFDKYTGQYAEKPRVPEGKQDFR